MSGFLDTCVVTRDQDGRRQRPPLPLTDQAQLKAISSVVRQRILGVLVGRTATIGGLASELGLARGSVGYHLGVLSDAGLVAVADSATVRGGREIRWTAVAGSFDLTAFVGQGAPAEIVRGVARELAGADHGGMEHTRVKRVRVRQRDFDAIVERLGEVFAELERMTVAPEDEDGHDVTLAAAFFRTRQQRRR